MDGAAASHCEDGAEARELTPPPITVRFTAARCVRYKCKFGRSAALLGMITVLSVRGGPHVAGDTRSGCVLLCVPLPCAETKFSRLEQGYSCVLETDGAPTHTHIHTHHTRTHTYTHTTHAHTHTHIHTHAHTPHTHTPVGAEPGFTQDTSCTLPTDTLRMKKVCLIHLDHHHPLEAVNMEPKDEQQSEGR